MTFIIDDNCYLNGKAVEFNPKKEYIIVVGAIAIGKSQYSKVMSKFNKNIQYYSVQQLEYLPARVRVRAIKIIAIVESDPYFKGYPEKERKTKMFASHIYSLMEKPITQLNQQELNLCKSFTDWIQETKILKEDKS